MKLPMYSFEPLLINVRVNLRRRNIGVAEHFLDDAQVGAVAQEMGRETMSQQVGIDVRLQS